jgi:hypothetical protein
MDSQQSEQQYSGYGAAPADPHERRRQSFAKIHSEHHPESDGPPKVPEYSDVPTTGTYGSQVHVLRNFPMYLTVELERATDVQRK